MTKPNIPQKSPHVSEVQPGNYAWCSCGQSQKEPFCDGTHKIEGNFKSVHVQIEEKKTIAWCGCKHTKTPPYCDGSHSQL